MRVALAAALWSAPALAAAAAPVHAQSGQLVAPMRTAGDQFGATVAVSGELAVIAAPGRSVSPFDNAGEVYLLARTGGAWSVTGSLPEMSTTNPDRALGRAAAMQGSVMVLGAPGFGGGHGLAYLYGFDANLGWVLQAPLQSPSPTGNDRFGVAVGLAIGAATQALVGETVDTLPPADALLGEVHVFDQANGWKQTQTLAPQDAQSGDRFGYALAADGELAVIGAPGKEGARGAAYMFVRQAGQWMQADKLVIAGERVEGDLFGAAVAIAGERVLVGAYGRGGMQGAAYVFERDGDGWKQVQELGAEAPLGMEWFGGRVALRGDRALISGHGFEAGPIGPRGGGYLFARDDEGFRLLAALRADDGVPGDQLGIGLALTDNEAFLGAPYDDASPDPASAPGSAYLFGLGQAPGEPCARDEDCGAGGLCCDHICAVAGCEQGSTGTPDEPTGSSGAGSSGEPSPTTGSAGESSGAGTGGGPPEAQYESGDAGCGCHAADRGAPGVGAWSLLGSLGVLLLRPRRSPR